MSPLFWFLACCAMSLFLGWRLRRDFRRGRASARGMSFSQETQPVRFRLTMIINALALIFLVAGAVSQAGELLGLLK